MHKHKLKQILANYLQNVIQIWKLLVTVGGSTSKAWKSLHCIDSSNGHCYYILWRIMRDKKIRPIVSIRKDFYFWNLSKPFETCHALKTSYFVCYICFRTESVCVKISPWDPMVLLPTWRFITWYGISYRVRAHRKMRLGTLIIFWRFHIAADGKLEDLHSLDVFVLVIYFARFSESFDSVIKVEHGIAVNVIAIDSPHPRFERV